MPGLRGFPYESPPRGWFQIAWSHELDDSAVVPLRYFGRDLVCYRGASGQIVVMDAHCKHLGAHLGYGGYVCDDDIVCPFHGWRWSSEGWNVEIPYTERGPHKGKRMGTWPVTEVSGMVLMWHGREDDEPDWFPPAVPEFEDEAYYRIDTATHCERVKFYPQFVAENQVDFAHLKYVHKWDEIDPQIEAFENRGVCFYSRTSGGMASPKGTIRFRVENETWGMGYIVSSIEGLRDTTIVISTTPVDDDVSDMRLTMAMRRPSGEGSRDTLDGGARALFEGQKEALYGSDPGDRDIWEHQIYIDTPPFPKEEARAFIALREWASQFYPES